MLLEPLQLPEFVNVDEKTYSPTYGKFEIGPLEQGFSTTIGNTLRRVLLSSIQGVAVKFVKIEGIHHEFTAIPGSNIDFVDLILRLKKLVFTKEEMGDDVLIIEKEGPCTITAADIQEANGLTVINKDLELLKLTEDVDFRMEIWVGVGRGFVAAEKHEMDEIPVGVIPIDTVFSPILKVNYESANQRVGERIDFDKLIMEIYTNGGIDPKDALYLTGKLLRDLYGKLVLFEEEPEYLKEVEMPAELKQMEKLLDMEVNELELTVRSSNCLAAAKIVYLHELISKSDAQMLKYRNFGKKSLDEISKLLSDYGLSLTMDVDSIRAKINDAKQSLRTNK
ncbi:MAG: DNA-directed RNA polymerase subunit alpha [Candidatus Cloacimonadota bacterium]|nr:DNA-directed RNA polymerase subunit alpha [Candidatus Cloacimonadota bacterium]